MGACGLSVDPRLLEACAAVGEWAQEASAVASAQSRQLAAQAQPHVESAAIAVRDASVRGAHEVALAGAGLLSRLLGWAREGLQRYLQRQQQGLPHQPAATRATRGVRLEDAPGTDRVEARAARAEDAPSSRGPKGRAAGEDGAASSREHRRPPAAASPGPDAAAGASSRAGAQQASSDVSADRLAQGQHPLSGAVVYHHVWVVDGSQPSLGHGGPFAAGFQQGGPFVAGLPQVAPFVAAAQPPVASLYPGPVLLPGLSHGHQHSGCTVLLAGIPSAAASATAAPAAPAAPPAVAPAPAPEQPVKA